MHVATSPAGTVLGYFRPLEKFNWIVTDEEGIPTVKGIYQPKFTYTIRSPELNAQVDAWVTSGQVKRIEV